MADLSAQPQDLAVEVERTAHDNLRNEVYRAVGVQELWECPRNAPRILDLQTPNGIRPVEESRILAGVRAEHLPATIDEIEAVGGLIRVWAANGARQVTGRDDEGGPRHIGEFIEGLMDIINGGGWQIWRAENDMPLEDAVDATMREVERGISPVGILVPLDAAALDALQRWAERTSAGAARRMTAREATAAAIQAALSSTARLRLVGGTDTEDLST